MLLVSLMKSLALIDSITLGHHVDLKRELSCMHTLNSYRWRFLEKSVRGGGPDNVFVIFSRQRTRGIW